MKRWILTSIIGAGGKAVAEVDLIAVDRTTARADVFGRPPRHSRVICVEIKTGFAEVRPNQEAVFNWLLLGGHVTTPNYKVVGVGLVPDVPLPPMEVLVIFAEKPGGPIEAYHMTPEHKAPMTGFE